jgi:hypothetical protein
VTVAQDQILIEQHIRQENGWLLVEHRDPLGSWTAAALQGVLTPIADIYEKVNWPEESTNDDFESAAKFPWLRRKSN